MFIICAPLILYSGKRKKTPSDAQFLNFDDSYKTLLIKKVCAERGEGESFSNEIVRKRFFANPRFVNEFKATAKTLMTFNKEFWSFILKTKQNKTFRSS